MHPAKERRGRRKPLGGSSKRHMKNPLSFSSVKLELFSKEDVHVNTASGFVIQVNNQYYLITNWHVVAGKHIPIHEPQQQEITPFTLKTTLHTTETQKWKNAEDTPYSWFWHRVTIQLYDNDTPRWIVLGGNKQHPLSADVIALPIALDPTKGLQSFNIRMQGAEKFIEGMYDVKISAIPIAAIDVDVKYGPGDIVHIIGYPLGWAPAGTAKPSAAFWRMSSIASELNEPGMIQTSGFFVDPCAPDGMSGSPVVGMKDNRMKLLGVYSHHSTEKFGVNAGLVSEASSIKELLRGS
jgi:hypothetical protein